MRKEVKVGDHVTDGAGTRGRVIRVDNPHAIFVEWYVPPVEEDSWTSKDSSENSEKTK